MKILLLLLVLFSLPAHSQEKTFEDYLSETSPVYPGCETEKLRHLCYQQKISEQVRDRVNTYLTNPALTNNDIALTLRLRSEKNTTLTVLKLTADNTLAEKAAAEAIAALPPIQPATDETGAPVVTTAGFVIKLHRDLGKPFEIVPPPRGNAASMPHPASMSRRDIVFPGCEAVPEYRREKCFSQNFTKWLLGKLGGATGGEMGLLALELTFDKEGKLERYRARKYPSEKLRTAVEKALVHCPVVQPGETNGEKVAMTYIVSVLFK